MYPLSVRIKQKIYKPLVRSRISTPYLSQAFFQSICDMTFTLDDIKQNSYVNAMSRSRVIYIRANELIESLSIIGPHIKNKIVVSGGADTEFHKDYSEFRYAKRLFLQNSFISDNKKIVSIPIGIENYSLALNGFPRYLKTQSSAPTSKVLVGPFSPTHPERQTLLDSLDGPEMIEKMTTVMAPRDYAKLARNYIAVACPRGNGEDTHRVWETLYRNITPIVRKTLWADGIKQLEIPLVTVSAWNKGDLAEAILQSHLNPINSKNIPALWSKYWTDRITQ